MSSIPIGPLRQRRAERGFSVAAWALARRATALGVFVLAAATVCGIPAAPAHSAKLTSAGSPGMLPAQATLPHADGAATVRYVPKPQAVSTGNYLVGAMMCPLWRQTSGAGCWKNITPYPEREPVLGWYDEGSPEVTDWEINFAREHGIGFFVPCWLRAAGNMGQPVKPLLDHWIGGLLGSRYAKQMRFAIMWENTNSIACDVKDEDDLLHHVLPYWIDHYFRTPSYLLIDGKPVLYIYTPSRLVQDLGGEEKARSAIRKMRAACLAAGFKGLLILGCDNTVSLDSVKQMADIGLDYSFAYHWPTFTPYRPPLDSLTPTRILQAQDLCWQAEAKGALPNIVTVSMGWDDRPWGGKAVAWQLPPMDFKALCQRAKASIDSRKTAGLECRMVLVDNWNEFGEGHYVFPTRQYGFGYLDALRSVFSAAREPHVDVVPADVRLGPYDSLYRAAMTP